MVNWDLLWFLWIGLFLVIEGLALFNSKQGDTLSEHVWLWFGIRSAKSGRKAPLWPRLVLGGFLLWLSLHFLTGGWI